MPVWGLQFASPAKGMHAAVRYGAAEVVFDSLIGNFLVAEMSGNTTGKTRLWIERFDEEGANGMG